MVLGPPCGSGGHPSLICRALVRASPPRVHRLKGARPTRRTHPSRTLRPRNPDPQGMHRLRGARPTGRSLAVAHSLQGKKQQSSPGCTALEVLGPPDGPPRRAPPKERENIASQSAHLGHTETWQPHQTPQKHHTTQSQGASPKPNPSIFSCARRKALLEEPGPQIAPPLRVEHLGVQSWWPLFHHGKAVRIFRAVAGRQADPA